MEETMTVVCPHCGAVNKMEEYLEYSHDTLGCCFFCEECDGSFDVNLEVQKLWRVETILPHGKDGRCYESTRVLLRDSMDIFEELIEKRGPVQFELYAPNDKLILAETAESANEAVNKMANAITNTKDCQLIEDFVENVLEGKDAFPIKALSNEDTFLFTSLPAGKAKWVYGVNVYKNERGCAQGKDLEPFALVANGEVYLVSEHRLAPMHWRTGTPLPPHTHTMSDVVNAWNRYMKEVTFPKFFEELPCPKNTNKEPHHRDVTRARELLFDGITQCPVPDIESVDAFNSDSVAEGLCGFFEFEEEAMAKLKAHSDYWTSVKSETLDIQALMDNPCVAEEWEKTLASALRDVKSKFVTIEFDFNGKQDVGKVAPDFIVGILANKDYFPEYRFDTRKNGEKLFKALGVTNTNRLRCEHIASVKFGGKTIWSRT